MKRCLGPQLAGPTLSPQQYTHFNQIRCTWITIFISRNPSARFHEPRATSLVHKFRTRDPKHRAYIRPPCSIQFSLGFRVAQPRATVDTHVRIEGGTIGSDIDRDSGRSTIDTGRHVIGTRPWSSIAIAIAISRPDYQIASIDPPSRYTAGTHCSRDPTVIYRSVAFLLQGESKICFRFTWMTTLYRPRLYRLSETYRCN